MSFSRVCLNMNARNGWAARSRATDWLILFARYGCSAFLLISTPTGRITKNVRSRAKPTRTCVGGTLWVPIAVRTNDSTTTIRVNDVTRTSSVGASASTVSSSKICSDIATCCGLVAGVMPMLICGMGTTGLVGPGTVGGAAPSAPFFEQRGQSCRLHPDRRTLRLDERLDVFRGKLRDQRDGARSGAYQEIPPADPHDVNRTVLGQKGRLDDADEPALSQRQHSPLRKKPDRPEEAVQEQRNERERTDRSEPKSQLHK